MFDAIIVGGGASGMYCAIHLARENLKVAILEKNDRLGKKLLATGNGRCNLSNINCSEKNYNSPFVDCSLKLHSPSDTIKEFNDFGLLSRLDDDKYYPHSLQASCVLNTLRKELERLNVKVFYNSLVAKISFSNNVFSLTAGEKFCCKNLIIATGSNASFGEDSLKLISSLGVKTIPFSASLTPFLSDKTFIKGLAGVRVKCNATLKINNEKVAAESGEVLFKDNGLSGIAMFNLSCFLARKKSCLNSTVILDLIVEKSQNELVDYLKKLREKSTNAEELLCGIFQKQISLALLKRCDISLSNLPNDEELKKLANLCKNYEIEVVGLANLSQAQVASGGVDTKEINQKTLAYVSNPQLYFCGEVVNVDGQCGGYNLQWAWSSAFAVAQSVINNIKQKIN